MAKLNTFLITPTPFKGKHFGFRFFTRISVFTLSLEIRKCKPFLPARWCKPKFAYHLLWSFLNVRKNFSAKNLPSELLFFQPSLSMANIQQVGQCNLALKAPVSCNYRKYWKVIFWNFFAGLLLVLQNGFTIETGLTFQYLR